MEFTPTLNVKMRGLIRLTRWKEFLPFVLPLTTFGALLALRASGGVPDWRLVIAILANTAVVAYAFMINDIEDAPDDALEAHRAARNPVACGELTPREGWIASGLVALLTLGLYALLGTLPFVVGAVTLAISHFYSWKPIRLKKWPVTDFVSHSLMLSGLLFLVGYFTYHNTPGGAWIVFAALTLVSCYGQLYNQVRDYNMDKAAGLRNTAIMIGERNTKLLMYAFVITAGLLLILSFVLGVVPLWVAVVPVLIAPIFLIHRPKGDARGSKAADFSGNMQQQVMLLLGLTMFVWLVAVMLRLA